MCAAIAATAPRLAHAQSYDLSLVAQAGQSIGGNTLTGVFSAPSLNDSGEVAFTAVFVGGQGIFTPNAVLARTGQSIGGQTITGFNNRFDPVGVLRDVPSLNNNGLAAFAANFGSGSGSARGIFTPNALLVQTGQTIDGRTLVDFVGFPSLNDNGQVAFLAAIDPRGGNPFPNGGIFTPDRLLIDGGRESSAVSDPSINNSGQVAVARTVDAPSRLAFLHLFSASGVRSTVAQSNSRFEDGATIRSILFSPSLNDRGQVAFVAEFSDSTSSGLGLFTTGSPSTPRVQTGQSIGGQTLTSILGGPSLNNSGQVAFLGGFAGGSGIFTRDALLAQTGQSIGGRTLTSVSSPSLNNNGDAAFFARFSDGTSGIVLARRAEVIPEPGTLALLLAGGVTTIGGLARRRRR